MKLLNSSLILILLSLAFTLRFYGLSENPPSLNWDEVSNGYNAYSIMKTAKDEYGNFLPLSNRSFDDYKPPMYMYLSVPSIYLFGLTEVAVRIPSAFLGTLLVLEVYFLARLLKFPNKVAHLSAFMVAINPWTLHFSRVGLEANIALFFTVGTFLFLALSVNNGFKYRFLAAILASLFFVSAIYSYHSSRIFTPIAVFTFMITFRKQILSESKIAIGLALLVVIGALLPLAIVSKDSLTKRFQATSQKALVEDLNVSVNLIQQDLGANQKLSNLIHNRRVLIARSTAERYISHFDINYLFTRGDDNFRHHIKNHGLLYLYLLPLIVVGFYCLAKNPSKQNLFLIFWLLIAPIPSAFGDAFPHSIRSLNMAVPMIVISSYGLWVILKNQRYKQYMQPAFILVVFIFALNYLHTYMIHYPKDEASWWQYGYKQAVLETSSFSKNQSVVIDTSIEQSYAFWLFYSKKDPLSYQREGGRGGFDNFNFNAQSKEGDILVTANNLPDEFTQIVQINSPDGEKIISIGKKEN